MRYVKSVFLFVPVFALTYLVLCYLPGLRIKLFAPPMEYFVNNIKHMLFFKSLVSVVSGALVTFVSLAIQRRKSL